MKYRYKVLESVLANIANDSSVENIFDEVGRLTSDERRHLKNLLIVGEDACHFVENDMGEAA